MWGNTMFLPSWRESLILWIVKQSHQNHLHSRKGKLRLHGGTETSHLKFQATGHRRASPDRGCGGQTGRNH